MSLSIEGERLLKAQDYKGAIEYFEAGLQAAKPNEHPDVLSAVYNQLGNACFYIGNFRKALEYHKKDLEIAQKLGDRNGQAKAYGNLGNTFKSLQNFDNAIKCCEQHLAITKELKDKLGEGRACYNLGNVHHAVGKEHMALKTPEGLEKGKAQINKAISFYKETLEITTNQKDKSGEGRALGNLGNAYTAIGNYGEAIKYHERRLNLAEAAKDLPAKARACGNLGNAYSALGAKDSANYSSALKFYQQSLNVARESSNDAGQAQAYYCIGATYVQLQNLVKAIENFELHLEMVTELKDEKLMVRVWFNLRNHHNTLRDTVKTTHYHQLIQAHNAKKNKNTIPVLTNEPTVEESKPKVEEPTTTFSKKKSKKLFGKREKPKPKDNNAVQAFSVDDSDDSDDGGIVRVSKKMHDSQPKQPAHKKYLDSWLDDAVEETKKDDAPRKYKSSGDEGFETLYDDNNENADGPDEAFFDLLVKMQGARLDEPKEDLGKKEEIDAIDHDNMSFFDMMDAAN